MAHKPSRAFAEIACDLQQVSTTPDTCAETSALQRIVTATLGISYSARDALRMGVRTIASSDVASPSQVGKVPPRSIEGRFEDGKSARPAALAATMVTLLSAVAACAALGLDTASSTDGGDPGPGVVLAAIVAVGPFASVALLAVLTVFARPALAGALTAGYGAVSVGQVMLDLGLVDSPIDANRLELFRPTTAEALDPAIGAYVLLGAHGAAVVGGILGLVAIGRASFEDGYGHSPRADLTGRASAVRFGGFLSVIAVVAALAAAAAMFAPPYISSDSIVLVPAVVESPLTIAIGSGLVALSVLVVVTAALASISPAVASAAVVGVGAGVFGLFGSRVVAGAASGAGIDVSTGAWVGAVSGAVLVMVGILGLPVSAVRDRRGGVEGPTRGRSSDAVHFMRWHVLAGACGVVAALALGAGALLPILELPTGLPDPRILATRTVAIAAFVLVIASVPLFFSLFAAVVRPALGVISVAALMASSGVLQSLVLATDIDGIGVGIGGFAIGVGAAAAAVCGLAVLVAGSAERDDVDTSDPVVDRPLAWVASIGGLVSAVGLGLPLYRGADVSAASFAEFPLGWDAWGQAVLAVTVLISVVVAARSRPARGAALLAGCVVAVVIYLLGWPLTQGRALDPSVGPGVAAGALGAVILAVAAILSARRRSQ